MHSLVLASLMTVMALMADTGVGEQQAKVFGHEEKVKLFPGGIKATARLDTGAATNSMYAVDTEVVEQGGQKHVEFTFVDHEGKSHRLSRPLIDEVTVTQASGQQRRYVVEMGLCLGDHYENSRFTLADRSHMTFPILVGRNFLKNSVLVSSSDTNTQAPKCDVRLG